MIGSIICAAYEIIIDRGKYQYCQRSDEIYLWREKNTWDIRKINKRVGRVDLNYLSQFILDLLLVIRRDSAALIKRISLLILSLSAWFTPRRDSPRNHRGVSTSCTRNPRDPLPPTTLAPLLAILDQFGLSLNLRSVAVRSHRERFSPSHALSLRYISRENTCRNCKRQNDFAHFRKWAYFIQSSANCATV